MSTKATWVGEGRWEWRRCRLCVSVLLLPGTGMVDGLHKWKVNEGREEGVRGTPATPPLVPWVPPASLREVAA